MRVLLVPNTENAEAVLASRSLSEWLAARGWEPILTEEDARACDLAESAVARTEIGEPALVVALGGDGTILKAVHVLGEIDAPVLGINLGRLGFLSGADRGSLEDAVGTALAGEGRVETRATLRATVTVGDREVGTYRALNEVFVGRGPSGRVIELAVSVNGTRLTRFACDGVVVATATGSTAYALSAGGPIVSPEVRGTVVVPVASHTLAVRPLILAPTDIVEISCPNPSRAEACVAVDGEAVPCRRALDRVEVSPGGRDVRLVKVHGRDFYEVVREKFLGGP